MPPKKLPGVFCLETPWSNMLTDGSTVRPLLDLLERCKAIRYAYRDAWTIEEFEAYVTQWSQKQYANYGFGYIACHGEPGAVHVGRQRYSIDELASLLEGRLAGRILYFGSCSTLDVGVDEIEHLRATTRARAVCGYTNDVQWIEAAAFELNLIEAVAQSTRIDTGFRRLERHHPGACERLGFRALWSTGSTGIA